MKRSTKWVLLTGLAAVVVVVLVLGAFLLGRSAPSNPAPQQPPPPNEQAAAEDGLARGTVPAEAEPPARGPGGLPQGFPQTPEGAAQAAIAYRDFFNKPPSQPVLDEALREVVGGGRDLDQRGVSFVELSRPYTIDVQANNGAYATEVTSPDAVTVYLWYPMETKEFNQVKWFWRTSTMRWTGGQWREPLYLNIANTPTEMWYGEGPTPADPRAILTPVDRQNLVRAGLGDQSQFPKYADWKEWADAP